MNKLKKTEERALEDHYLGVEVEAGKEFEKYLFKIELY